MITKRTVVSRPGAAIHCTRLELSAEWHKAMAEAMTPLSGETMLKAYWQCLKEFARFVGAFLFFALHVLACIGLALAFIWWITL